MAFLNVDLNTIDEESGYAPIPAGIYTAQVTACESHQNKNGTGSYLRVRWDITGPKHQGRVIFDNVNYVHQNIEAQTIGLKRLKSMLVAGNVPFNFSSPSELVGISTSIEVKVKKSEQYGEQNEIGAVHARPTGFAPSNVTSMPAAQQAAPAAQAASSAKAPWAK